jgi:hypothetical protein
MPSVIIKILPSSTVQWSSGYDFCLTSMMCLTEGLQFDPGLDHFLARVYNELIYHLTSSTHAASLICEPETQGARLMH